VTEKQLEEARNLIRNKPYLMWSTKSYDQLSPESIFESTLCYGDWPDFTRLVEIFGLSKSAEFFNSLKSKKRTNLRPQTINLFSRYFEKHAHA